MVFMVPSLGPRSLVRESAPVAVILLFWVGLSSFVRPVIATGLVRAGVIMALLYTIVRGVRLARTHQPTPEPDDLEGLLRENVRVALPAAAWFLAAYLVYALERTWTVLGIPGWDTSPAEVLAFVFTGAGVAVVLLHAITVGVPRIRGNAPGTGSNETGAAPADD